MASSDTARMTSVIKTSINVKPFLLCNEFNLTPPCPFSKNKNRTVVLIKPRQSGRIDLLRQPGCPPIRDPWLSPPAPSLAQRASHRLRRAGVPRLLVVWLYRSLNILCFLLKLLQQIACRSSGFFRSTELQGKHSLSQGDIELTLWSDCHILRQPSHTFSVCSPIELTKRGKGYSPFSYDRGYLRIMVI
jgi:hypothetical protein